MSQDNETEKTAGYRDAPEPVILELDMLADAGDRNAVAMRLNEITDEYLADWLPRIREDRCVIIWHALPEPRRDLIRKKLDPELSEFLDKTPELLAQKDILDELNTLLKEGESDRVHQMLASLSNDDIVNILDSMPVTRRITLWELVPEYQQGEVLSLLGDNVRQTLLKKLDQEEVVSATIDLHHDDLVDVVSSAPDVMADAILQSLDVKDRELIEARLEYGVDSAGRLMETEWIAVRADVSLGVVSRYLKRRGDLPPHTDGLMVVDRQGLYLGKLLVSSILTLGDELVVGDVMIDNAEWVSVNTSKDDIADMFERREVSSVAVVDDEHRLVGRITLDEALDLIREKAETPLMHMAGLKEDEDLFAPITSSALRRMLWLGINLVTAFIAAWVIGLFEATLQKIVALAVLMPIVASMGGIAGSQTLTLAIRGLALGQISSSNTRWLLVKEVAIAAINGLIWAVVVGLVAYFWFGESGISIIIGIAMIINQFAAALSGIAVPLILDKYGIDPALSGSVVLTTVTDVVGFMSFLGLATILLV